MKRIIGIIVAIVLLAVLLPRLNACDHKDSYTATGFNSNSTTFTATAGEHHVYAYATLNSSATSQIVQQVQGRPQVVLQTHVYATGSRSTCSHDAIAGGGSYYQSSATVSTGGEATCIGYDNSSQYYQQALCQQQPGQ